MRRSHIAAVIFPFILMGCGGGSTSNGLASNTNEPSSTNDTSSGDTTSNDSSSSTTNTTTTEESTNSDTSSDSSTSSAKDETSEATSSSDETSSSDNTTSTDKNTNTSNNSTDTSSGETTTGDSTTTDNSSSTDTTTHSNESLNNDTTTNDSTSNSDNTMDTSSSDTTTNNTTDSSESNDSASNESTTTTITYRIIDTNQQNCYNTSGSQVSCSGTGQDGSYSGTQPSYTDNGDGTVTDNNTNLIWQQSPDTNGDGVVDADDKFTQSNAVSYCESLTLGGKSDWRLPDIKTLYSLMDFSGEDPSNYTGSDTSVLNPFIDTSYFDFGYGDTSADERIIDAQWATTSIYVSNVMNSTQDAMFGLNLADGRIKGYGVGVGGNGKTFYVQCVRGSENYAQNSFVDNGDETISDTATGLMWQKNDNGSSIDWDSAISYCEDLSLAGKSDWRVPNAKELHSIVDYTRSPDTTASAAIDAIFNATSIINEARVSDFGFYWSATTHKNMANGANAVYISFGRALGYMNGEWLDVHGAGAQRSDPKDISTLNTNDPSYTIVDGAVTHGPQGDLIRGLNFVRCVRDNDTSVAVNSDETKKNDALVVSDGYILFSTMGSKDTYIIDNDGDVVKTIASSYRSSGASYLSESYSVLRLGKTDSTQNGTFADGGAVAGIIEEFDEQGNVIWSFTRDSDSATLHHDFKAIDNNTLIALAWELKSYNGKEYWNEKIIKIDKSTKSVIWEWRAMEDGGLYPTSNSEDYLHFNSIDYKDGEILISSRTQNTLYLINESTKAITQTLTAQNSLDGQHDASFLDNGNILLFNNGTISGTSSVVEIDSSDSIVWEYSASFYSDHISGAQRLSNGNTLICSGVEGEFIEVNANKEVVWSYTNAFVNSTPMGESNSVFKIRKYESYTSN